MFNQVPDSPRPSSIAMRFTSLCAVVVAAVTSVGGVPTASAVRSTDISLDLGGLFGGADLSSSNHYGAPIPPWEPGCKPGWYYGPNPGDHPDLPCLGGVCIMTMILKCAWHCVQLICEILDLIPFIIHCPHNFPPTTPPSKSPPSKSPPSKSPPSDGYTQTFYNITAAVQADDYMTFGLVDTVADCKAMCDSVDGCKFVNSKSPACVIKWYYP